MTGTARNKWVFFTDLDGTLLDHSTYRWNAAHAALEAIKNGAVPLVIVTSKTRAEVMPLLRKLGRREPFVVENGGGMYVPIRYFPFRLEGASPAVRGWRKVSLGTPYRKLVAALQAAARTAHVRVRGFAQMRPGEVAAHSGLGSRGVRGAMAREFDEPFLILDENPGAWPRLRREIRRRGLNVTRGSRFFHIMGDNDKGVAVSRLTTWFRRALGPRMCTVGLGDSPNDIPLLRTVDVPILVARPGGRYDPSTLEAVPGARRAGGVGPAGWNRAVLKLLRQAS